MTTQYNMAAYLETAQPKRTEISEGYIQVPWEITDADPKIV